MEDLFIQLSNIATVYVTGGFLYILVSAAAWLMLKNRVAFAPSTWCLGGGLLGVGVILLGLRGHVPPWLSFLVSNSALVLGNLLHVYALRKEVGKPLSWFVLVAIFLLVMVPWLYFFRGLQDPVLRFIWIMGCLTALLAWTGWLGRSLAQREHNKSAFWLAAVYALTALIVGTRGLAVGTGWIGVDLLVSSPSSLWVILGVVLSAVLGNVAIIGLYLERAEKTNVAFAKEQERQAALSALGDRVADQYRLRSLDELSSALAHELGQPITGVLFDSNTLKTRLAQLGVGDARARSSLDSLDAHAVRAKAIIESIRSFAKPAETRFEILDLQSVIDDVVRLVSPSVREGRIDLNIQRSGEPMKVIGNRVLLSLVFLNVFRNAMQANRQSRPAQLNVSFRRVDTSLEVHMKDDGPGFPSHMLTRIGTAYFTTKEDGMGVGLALCHRIAEQHNGELQIRNSTDQRGAVVELHLPLWAGGSREA